MNDIHIDRPKVSKVKVKVTPVTHDPFGCQTEVIVTFDSIVTPNEFLFRPALILGPSDTYEIDKDIEPDVLNNIVTYTIPGKVLEGRLTPFRININFANNEDVEYTYQDDCS